MNLNDTTFRKRIYTPATLWADLRDFWRHAEDMPRMSRHDRVNEAFGERLMLAVTAVNGCRYCSYAHTKAALACGLEQQEIDKLLEGEVGHVPETEQTAVLFAQHYAETGGSPDPEMLTALERCYGVETAQDILTHLRMITLGNLVGNTADAILSRFQGQPAADSSLVSELGVFALLAVGTPLLGIGIMLKRFQDTKRSSTGIPDQSPEEVKAMDILVYGAGVIGSLYAARLAQAGYNVSLLARGDRADELRAHGIQLQDVVSGQRWSMPVKVVEALDPQDRYDLAIVLLPKNHISEVLPILQDNLHIPDILFLGNNCGEPLELCQAVGRQRVVLGFPGAGGTRREGVVHYVDSSANGARWPITLGEIDGAITPRLRCIAALMEHAGIPVELSDNMDAWLKTHAAIILPIAGALYTANADPERLAKTRDSLVLMLRGMQEGLQVLQRLGIPIIPKRYQTYRLLPEPLLLMLARHSLQQEATQFALVHADAARDEFKFLAQEFSALASRANYVTPVLDYMYEYLDPTIPPIAEGSERLTVNWRDVWLFLGGAASLIAMWRLVLHRHKPNPENQG